MFVGHIFIIKLFFINIKIKLCMSITKESRLISANSQEWEKIKDILGNRVPRNTSDPVFYGNSSFIKFKPD
jgi:hypothetical protein